MAKSKPFRLERNRVRLRDVKSIGHSVTQLLISAICHAWVARAREGVRGIWRERGRGKKRMWGSEEEIDPWKTSEQKLREKFCGCWSTCDDPGQGRRREKKEV